MKEKLKNKKVVYTIIGIVSVLLVALAVTYAYWLVTKTQTNENVISSACLDISISGEKNDITLSNQFPMSDEDGMKLVPYEFTVTNNCNTSVDYQVALEAIGDSSNALSATSLKVALDDSSKLYSEYSNVDTTVDGSYESRKLATGTLASSGNEGSSKAYSLRIWIDKDAPISEMSKTFKSRISVTIGQGIESPYEEETLAYSILKKVGGSGVISEINPNVFTHGIYATENLNVYELDDIFYGTEYIYDEETGMYSLSGLITQATLDECRNQTKTCGKYTLSSTSATFSNTILYEVIDFYTDGGSIKVNNIGYNNAFGKVTTASEAGLYKTQDDLGDSYYFRGAPTNNYVEFGTYAAGSTVNGTTYNEETPMYWRMVRINGDGTVRLVYDGTTKAENGTSHTSIIGDSAYNTNFDNAKYVGYTYDDGTGTQVDSDIKGMLDTWYDAHLEANYGKYIADGIFCNDRSIVNVEYLDEDWNVINDSNAAVYTNIEFGGVRRISDYIPSLKCPNKEDRYTMDDIINGNGLLSNPVGLMTADEVMFAGNNDKSTNENCYLYTETEYITLTPASMNYEMLFMYYINSQYGLMGAYTNSTSDVRPVINLKADVKFTGDGTIDNPYKIVTE